MALYGENALEANIERCQNLVKSFQKKFTEEDVTLFSSPGHTEISGNHTNHNHGKARLLRAEEQGILLKQGPVSKITVFGFMNLVFGVLLSALFWAKPNSTPA